MKRVEKNFVKIDFKIARFEVIEGNLVVVEMDKNGDIVEQTVFLDAIEDLIGENDISITIKKERDIE